MDDDKNKDDFMIVYLPVGVNVDGEILAEGAISDQPVEIFHEGQKIDADLVNLGNGTFKIVRRYIDK